MKFYLFLNFCNKTILYYLDYYEKDSIGLSYYDYLKDDTCYIGDSELKIKETIYSISISTIENKILICLLDKKNVKIFDYDIENKKLKINEKEINDSTTTGINNFLNAFKFQNIFSLHLIINILQYD